MARTPARVSERLLAGRKVSIQQNGIRTGCALWVPYSIKPAGSTGPGGFHIGHIHFVLKQITSRAQYLKRRDEIRFQEWLETPGHVIPSSWFVTLGATEETPEAETA